MERDEKLLKLIEEKLGSLFEQKKERKNSGIPSAKKKLKLFVDNGYIIKDELKNILKERNQKIISSIVQ